MKTQTGQGFGARYDSLTPNAITRAQDAPTGLGYWIDHRTRFCIKCQRDKPRTGSKLRAGMYFCADCK